MTLTSEYVEETLELVQNEIENNNIENTIIEVSDFSSDGYIIFAVNGLAENFSQVVEAIDKITFRKSLSYSVTYHSEQVDYR